MKRRLGRTPLGQKCCDIFNAFNGNEKKKKNMFCCCCEASLCAILLCVCEIVVSLMVWYQLAVLVSQTFSNLQLKDVLLLLLVSAWLITLFTSTFTLILAHKRQNADFVLPRIVQQSGLLIIGFLIALLILAYFSGGATVINNFIIGVYEKLMLDEPLSKDERRDAHDALKYCFMALILVDFFFIVYEGLGLCITKRFHSQLKQQNASNMSSGRRLAGSSPAASSYAGYGPVPRYQPSAPPPAVPPPPPPPYNPSYKN